MANAWHDWLSLVVDTLGLLRSLQVSLTWTKALGLRHFFETFQKCTTHNSGWTSLFFGWFVFWNFWILFGNFWEKFKFKNGRSWAVTSLLFLGSRHPHKNMNLVSFNQILDLVNFHQISDLVNFHQILDLVIFHQILDFVSFYKIWDLAIFSENTHSS